MLAIDTVSALCSVALFEDGALLDWRHERIGRGHAERLVPMIAELPDRGRADHIRVDIGPGSFTGVRVGIAAARALGLAWGADVAGYGALDVLARIARAEAEGGPIDVATQGGHGELFVAAFDAAGQRTAVPASLSPEAAAAALTAPLIVGDAAEALVALRGHGRALTVLPDARAAALLDTAALGPASACYARAADARPSSVIRPVSITPVSITSAGIDELVPAMAVMEAAFDPGYGEAWNRAQLANTLLLPETRLLIGRVGDAVAGFALARALPDEVELLLLAVVPRFRSIGHGTALVEAVLQWGQSLKLTRAFLEMRDNNRAGQLYRRLGFKPVGRRANYYRGADGQRHDAVTMIKLLADDAALK